MFVVVLRSLNLSCFIDVEIMSMSNVSNTVLTVVSCISEFSFNQYGSLVRSADFLIYFIIV